MRVLLIQSACHPLVGGVEELTSRLARTLIEGGHAVEVWTHRYPVGLSGRAIAGVTVRRGPVSFVGDLATAKRVRSKLEYGASVELVGNGRGGSGP